MDTTGTLSSQFSENYLNLQKDFCCDTGNLKVIRWVGCKPGVYKGSKTLFSSDDLAMCSWFQSVENYSYSTVDLDPGGVVEIELKGILYFLGKAVWPSDALNSLKHIEIGLNKQAGVIGSTIPFPIGTPNPPDYDYRLIRDLFTINTSSSLEGPMIINNCSPYNVSFSMLYAY